jgi:hypothetical protein
MVVERILEGLAQKQGFHETNWLLRESPLLRFYANLI